MSYITRESEPEDIKFCCLDAPMQASHML